LGQKGEPSFSLAQKKEKATDEEVNPEQILRGRKRLSSEKKKFTRGSYPPHISKTKQRRKGKRERNGKLAEKKNKTKFRGKKKGRNQNAFARRADENWGQRQHGGFAYIKNPGQWEEKKKKRGSRDKRGKNSTNKKDFNAQKEEPRVCKKEETRKDMSRGGVKGKSGWGWKRKSR